MLILGVALGLGVLTKGPFILGVLAFTAAALRALTALEQWRAGRSKQPAGTVGATAIRRWSAFSER